MSVAAPCSGWSPRPWGLRLVTAALIGLLAISWSAGSANAHTKVSGSTPADGATVTSLDSVSVTFVDPVLGKFASIAMTAEDDQPVPLSEPAVKSDTVTATLPGGSPGPGRYVVSYRAVALDGHPITGSIAFTLDPPQAASERPSPSAVVATPSPSPEAATPASRQDTGPSLLPAAGLGVMAALLVGVGLRLLRRRFARK